MTLINGGYLIFSLKPSLLIHRDVDTVTTIGMGEGIREKVYTRRNKYIQ